MEKKSKKIVEDVSPEIRTIVNKILALEKQNQHIKHLSHSNEKEIGEDIKKMIREVLR